MGAVLPDGISSQKINRIIDWFLTAQLPMSTCHQNLYSSEDDYSPLPPSRYVWIDKIWLFSFVIFAFNCYSIVCVCMLFVDFNTPYFRLASKQKQNKHSNLTPKMSKCLFLCLVATVQTISMTTSIIQQTASRQSLFVFFFSFEQLFNSIKAKFIAVCDSREHYFIISVCRAFIFTRKNDNLQKLCSR
jgi:hypothetical protein